MMKGGSGPEAKIFVAKLKVERDFSVCRLDFPCVLSNGMVKTVRIQIHAIQHSFIETV